MLPNDWTPPADMKRIIVHWTAGGYVASSLDREHYHLLIEGDGNVVRGHPSIKDNVPPLREGVYAAHTKGTNSNSIGVSVCAMAGATEQPFNAGKYPLKKVQWDKLAHVLAELSKRYKIPISRSTILTHAEVQQTLGRPQNGKWDIAALPFDPARGSIVVGDKLRAAVTAAL